MEMMMIRVVMTMMAMTMLVKREVIMMKMIKMYDGDVDDDNRVVKIRVDESDDEYDDGDDV